MSLVENLEVRAGFSQIWGEPNARMPIAAGFRT
jgi:hypothetical protein